MINYIIVYFKSCFGYDWSVLDKKFGLLKIYIIKFFNRLELFFCMLCILVRLIIFIFYIVISWCVMKLYFEYNVCIDCVVYICNVFVYGYIIDFCIIEDRSILVYDCLSVFLF